MRSYMAERLCLYASSVLFFFFISMPACAFFTVKGDDYSMDLGGSFRSTAAWMRNYNDTALFGWNNDYDGASESILRITSTGEFHRNASFEIHLLADAFFTSADSAGSLSGTSLSSSVPMHYRISRGSWEVAGDDDFCTSLDADRLNIKYALSDVDITIGRQAINFSQAYFWNPLDVFMSFDPETFDRDYKPGVDALRVDIALGNFSSLTFVAAPGREMNIDNYPFDTSVSPGAVNTYASAFMARACTNIEEVDLTLQSGKIYGGYQIGAGFSGGISGAGIRGEAAYLAARPEGSVLLLTPLYPAGVYEADLVKDSFSAVVGGDFRFDNSLYINLEYLYNSAGKTGGLDEAVLRSMVSHMVSLGRHLAGLQLSYEFHPLLTGQAALVHSFSDRSSMVSPTATYSVSNEAEFIAGAILCFGKRPHVYVLESSGGALYTAGRIKSEFGTRANMFFAEFKFYF